MLQEAIIRIAKPYIRRELPGWGRLMSAVASYKRDWLWRTAPVKQVRGKLHNYLMHLNLAEWPDRSTFFLDRWYDLETQLFLAATVRPGDTVIDVGANRGMFALTASRIVGPTGRVVCFEPNPRCVSTLELEIRSNQISNIDVHKVGLGAENGTLKLTVPQVNSGQGTFSQTLYDGDATYRLDVPVVTGDSLLAGVQPSFIKMDVEGFELNALRGLVGTIRRSNPILVHEVSPNFMKSLGYCVSDIRTLMGGLDYQGYMLTLIKKKRGYDWSLVDFPNDEQDCDVVWIHQTKVADLRARYPANFH
jgi:FkbM family methyltransferase